MCFTPCAKSRVTISLARNTATCGGITPLRWLLVKLARAGDTRALAKAYLLPLSMDSRIVWLARGNALTVSGVA